MLVNKVITIIPKYIKTNKTKYTSYVLLSFTSKKIRNENLIFFTKRYFHIYRKRGELYLRKYILRLLKYFYCASRHKKLFSVPYKTESVTNISILAMFQTTK